MSRNVIPVFFTVDERYAPYLSTALISLLEHTTKKHQYEINIIHHHISHRTLRKLERLGSGYDNVKLIFTEMQETLEGISDRKSTRLKADCFTPTIYYRIFLPEMFPQYDKGIYLDSDLIVLEDVAKLFEIDMGDNLLAACLDMSTFGNKLFTKYFEEAIGVGTDSYFNSGVLLIDFRRFRDEEFCEHFLYLLNTYDFDTVAPDQDYLNAMCKGRVKYLDISWNTMPTSDNLSKEKLKIIHYNLFFKPWHHDGTRYEEYFWKYAAKSSFLRDIQREKRDYAKKSGKTDDERLIQMSQRVMEILDSEITFKKVFNGEMERKNAI
ncbi:glycosyltransferase family 8 protein [Candidatus Saccharibacteria bacterium]|nr:glycosyltransferase family 8 protein [Candidatus Saccharibacteria bacterium]